LLGTLVTVGCEGLSADRVHPRIDAAFAAIADVHRLMSFHETHSDVTRLNQRAAQEPVAVDARTFFVLSLALDIARATAGLFDICVADTLVAWGRLPRPPHAPAADPGASWRDIELLEGQRVRFHRPLWVDLGGIAKGYAVDCAIRQVEGDDASRWTVNAGGDLRVAGEGLEHIVLRTDAGGDASTPVIALENGSLASSSGRGRDRRIGRARAGPHIDGRDRRAVGARLFVSVLAKDCAIADALTKVVLAAPRQAGALLEHFGATAFLQGARGGWSTLGAGR
jgi:thiamine biosynthesis lipoprotein